MSNVTDLCIRQGMTKMEYEAQMLDRLDDLLAEFSGKITNLQAVGVLQLKMHALLHSKDEE